MEEGVRGVYLNEINRTQAAHIAGAFSNILWESLPLKGLAPQKSADHLVKTKSQPDHNSYSEKSRGPNVVIGFDERSSSPDIVTGVASALRRNGCRVIDLGLTVPAVMSYAMTHLQAQGAIMVTGSQFGPSYTGLEFLQEHSLPVSANHGLEQIEERARTGFGRASRQPGSQRTFHPLESYRAQFGKHFHALRPLKISIACSLRLVRETLNTLFEKLPCQLSWIEIPNQKRDLLNPLDIDVLKMNQSLQTGDFDLGIIIDDDSRRCAFFDETGALLPQHLISWFLMKALAAEHTNQIFLLDKESQELLPEIPPGWDVSQHDGTLADSYMQMQNKQAVYAGSHTGYHWFRETVPTCDAILTLAHVLAALSFSDAPFSEALSQ
ncbi:Phosphomannomutase/phosphoglucomutase [Gimesia aquarii]|uniref:Phosphomannomutase/phosphoglucomutase n=2 Tax=Gimesia aquarii TaxID=2527964 RepID=A0A517VT72_9PLAN|nr:Phosphomannomutase/phosphoglucomutase [Gimesia aquarii]